MRQNLSCPEDAIAGTAAAGFTEGEEDAIITVAADELSKTSNGESNVFEVSVRDDFSAAHRLRDYPGKCEKLHGHNWTVEVFVCGKEVNGIGIIIDFGEVKAALRNVLAELDHRNLNEIAPFDDLNPSSENLAKYVYGKVKGALNTPGLRVSKVCVCETPESRACYWEE